MTFESFVDIHKGDTPKEKLVLLVDTMELLGNKRVDRTDARWRRNDDDAEYYSRECQHMIRRAKWLRSELERILEDKTTNADI